MSRPWHETKPRLLAQVREDLAGYPGLGLAIEGQEAIVHGRFPVLDVDRLTVLDEYEVEFRFPRGWPEHVPVVRETGGRIPVGPERHLDKQRTACVLVEEEWLLRPDHDSLRAFLIGPVRNYFLWQSLVEAGKPEPWQGRPHGPDGAWQAYGEWCGTTDPAETERYLRCLAPKKVKGHLSCPCGSGRRLRGCHQDRLLALRLKIPRKIAERALERIRSLQDPGRPGSMPPPPLPGRGASR